MIRQFLKKKLRSAAVQLLNMEFDTEEVVKRPPRSTPTEFDQTIIPKIVDGSGDTPGPNHKQKIGRTWVSAHLLSGTPTCIIDIRPPNEVLTGMLPSATLYPGRTVEHFTHNLPDKKERIIVYDQTGELGSATVAEWLRQQGWDGARFLEGGFAEWIEQGEQIVSPKPLGEGHQLGDSFEHTDGTRAQILSVRDGQVELWNVTDDYIGWVECKE